jgi:PIN domain nuclease of toxin-antitoxin system
VLKRAGFGELDIKSAHAEVVAHLPFHHADPFDRLLIAQGQLEGLTIMTADDKFALYGIDTV